MGLTFSLEETLHVEGPGSWRFVVPGAGFEIVDRYTVQDEGESCHLRIRSTMTYENTLGKLARKAMVPSWKDKFTEVFTNAVAVFEDRHARPETVTGSP